MPLSLNALQKQHQSGLSLVELLVTIFIMGIVAMAAMPLLDTSLKTHDLGTARSRLYQEGLAAMERMTAGTRACTFLSIPNAHTPTRDMLVFSGTVNEDNDYYFADPLFPRIDEDPKKQMTDDGESGIIGLDDDGDTLVDESGMNDDDEDGTDDEDPLDGVDNDGDGNIDEDTGDDANVAGMDDDADGTVDEGDSMDDDEDGLVNEDHLNPLVYSWNNATSTLLESSTHSGDSAVLSTRVSQFQAVYQLPDAAHGPRVRITLTLTADDGETLTFAETVFPRNVLQRTGKRVR